MHSAPAVRYPVALSQRVIVTAAVLWFTAAALWAWWYATDTANGRLAWGFTGLVFSGGLAVVLLRAAPRGSLRWDGQAWWWQTGEADIQVTVTLHFDFQRLVVLRVGGLPGRDPWCCVDSAGAPRAWGDLRRALVASARTARAPDGARGSAP